MKRTLMSVALRPLHEELELEAGESSLILPTSYEDLVAVELFMPGALARLAGWASFLTTARPCARPSRASRVTSC